MDYFFHNRFIDTTYQSNSMTKAFSAFLQDAKDHFGSGCVWAFADFAPQSD
jgi:hypothetical protein